MTIANLIFKNLSDEYLAKFYLLEAKILKAIQMVLSDCDIILIYAVINTFMRVTWFFNTKWKWYLLIIDKDDFQTVGSATPYEI